MVLICSYGPGIEDITHEKMRNYQVLIRALEIYLY